MNAAQERLHRQPAAVTGGSAGHSSGLSVQSFLRGIHVVEYTEAALRDVARHVAAVASGLNRYPDREFVRLREDLAAYLTGTTGVAVTAAQVWAGNGSNEVLLHILQAFGGVGRVALGFTPTYSMHSIITQTVGTGWVDGLRGVDGGGPCLLYTSPSPRDRQKSRMPSSA